jgi:hypothetical protein
MATQSEPNLRLVKVSHDLADEPRDDARSTSDQARSFDASEESSALAQPYASEVAGEIRNDHPLAQEVARNATLLGFSGFPAVRSHAIERSKLFVAPATVTAIERARALKTRYVTEPSIRVQLPHEGIPKLDKPLRGDARPHGTPVPDEQQTDNKWQQFEDLGLAPRPTTKKLQKLIVSTYRLIGFSILSLIVAVLVGYIAQSAFYFLNKTWVTPVVLSANDEKVVGLQSQLASQLNERARLVAELEEAERAIVAEQTFQIQFAKAIKRDAAGRREALGRVQQLASAAASTRNQIRNTNGDYSASTVNKMEGDYKLGLINRDAMLSGKYQLAQISSANLSLAERQAEFDQRAAELAAQTQSLDVLLSDKSQSAALSYDVLKIARDYDTSKLSLARQTSNRERLRASIQRQDQIINGVYRSAYMKAIADNATVALVPYSNLKNIEKGTPLYACKFDMIWCHEVGKVLDILPGEVMVKQPNRDSMVRGRMIEMQMSDPDAAEAEVLFAGSAPLWL